MPTKELPPISKYVIDVNFPISDGMEPVNLFPGKPSTLRPIILHTLVGIVPPNKLFHKYKEVNVNTFPILLGIVPDIPLLLISIFIIFDPLHVTPVHDGLPHTLVLGTPLAHRHPVRPVMVPRFVDDAKSHANASLTLVGVDVGVALGANEGIHDGCIVGSTLGIQLGITVGDLVGFTHS